MYDCIIIGSGPAGMTAALYMCRENYKIALVTGTEIFGSLGKISCIENFPGIESIQGYNLALKMYEQLDKFENLTKHEFLNAVSFEKRNNEFFVELSDGYVINGKSLIISIGGKHKTIGLKNEEKYFGNGISFCATCDGPFYKNKNVAIIGGGNTAMDFALSLSKYCKNIDIIHRRNEFRADITMINKVSKLKNVNFILNSNVIDILTDKNSKFNGLKIKNNDDNSIKTLNYDGCFYALGFEKNEINEKNAKNNKHENIFYAGDCINEKYKQVITACGDGCKAALDCILYLENININV